tara:strand:+ start:37 stop:444 length:408 start_codon:yes stop_codon:yes gene_type:complete
MALPASGPISSSQVATEFDVSQTDISLSNLGTKLADSIPAGNPVNLATSFYGQSSSTCTEFACAESPSKEGVEGACEQDPEATYYHNGSGTYPVAGDNVFYNSACTLPLDDGAYKIGSGVVMVVESATVEELVPC